MPDLYTITDRALAGIPNEEQVRQMIDGGARLIQLRDKSASDTEFALCASHCLGICRWAGATFIVNDRVEIAKLIGADGVHLGQGDLSVAAARAILGADPIVGISTHNRDQFEAALPQPVNYIALGPVFRTTTKRNPEPSIGLDLVREANDTLKGGDRPLVLIGGINRENLAMVREAAPEAYIAVIGAIMEGGRIGENVRRFREAIQPPKSSL